MRPRLLAGLSILVWVASGCVMPSAVHYQPTTERESDLLALARRDVLPGDVREAPSEPPTLVAWTGILREKNLSDGRGTFLVEHHYWDWIVDLGTQSTRVFLSPRGEGSFEFSVQGEHAEWLDDNASEGDMVIVYGIPELGPEGILSLRYAHARGIPPSHFATDVWDYDRGFAVRGTQGPTQLQIDAF